MGGDNDTGRAAHERNGSMSTSDATREKARHPEDITRLFVERSNAGDADGVAALYDEHAVLAYPPGQVTVGRTAIRELWASVLEHRPTFTPEEPLPTLVCGDIALTSTPPHDDAGARAQVLRRQSDGSWLRIIDQPELNPTKAPLTTGSPTSADATDQPEP
jgi:ketosteroid isomerase-like protein